MVAGGVRGCQDDQGNAPVHVLGRVAIAGDFRPSTDRVMEAVRRAAADMGYTPINCGKVPSPAVALYGLVHRVPAIMVTGSHIPADRNGIKFNKCTGEILKADETAIRQQAVCVDEGLFSDVGQFAAASVIPWPLSSTARDLYIARYLDCFPCDCLAGQRIGLYQHSAVGRDILPVTGSRHFRRKAVRPFWLCSIQGIQVRIRTRPRRCSAPSAASARRLIARMACV